MSFEVIIARYGLAAVCVGAGVEGETAAIAGGVLAHQHLISLSGVVIAAALGSFVADQGFFSIGRTFRQSPYVQKMLHKPVASRAIDLLERYPDRFILAIRFLYGIRTLSPIAVGTSEISRSRFVLLNAIAAAFWAMLFTTIGFELGDGLKVLLRHAHPSALIGLLAIIVGTWLIFRTICRRHHHRVGCQVHPVPAMQADRP
jgi:membrane protein DedA with SNARE-associated domain